MRFLFSLLLFLCLTACQAKKGDTVQVTLPPTAQNPSDQMGTGDSGGGNGINGKALESYRIDVTALPEYHEFVLPALHRLQKLTPVLASELEYIATARNWYFIPIPLQNLSKEQIGVGFNTDQIALQTHQNIWMDNRHYSKMTAKEKGTILMHEMVMGLKILSWSSPIDRCYASAIMRQQRQTCSAFNSIFTQHDIFKHLIQNQKIKLKTEDYDNIRKVTGDLINKTEPKSTDQVISWISGIQRYPYLLDEFNSYKLNEQKLTPLFALESIQALALRKKLPRFGGFEEIAPDAESTTYCHLDIKIDVKSNQASIRFAEQRRIDKEWINNFEIQVDPFAMSYGENFIGTGKNISFHEKLGREPKVGDTRRTFYFSFRSDKLESFSVDIEVYSTRPFDDYSSGTWESQESFERVGDKFLLTRPYCTEKPNFQFQL